MNADGFHQRRITFQGSFNDSSTWSPKGDLIAFVSRSAGIFDIYTTNTEGLDWKRLTINQRKNEDPCFSPDGQHIAFSSNRTGKYQIYIMDIDGRNQRQLTFDGENTSPNWSGFYE
jgi:TolB protein